MPIPLLAGAVIAILGLSGVVVTVLAIARLIERIWPMGLFDLDDHRSRRRNRR